MNEIRQEIIKTELENIKKSLDVSRLSLHNILNLVSVEAPVGLDLITLRFCSEKLQILIDMFED